MKRIGLFLGAETSSSGVYKYNQVMLHAVDALPRDGFEVTIAYYSDLWDEQVDSRNCRKMLLAPKRAESEIMNSWEYYSLPTNLWRRLCPYWNSVARAFLGEKCDLWIFPSQDFLSYLVPVPALVSVHDLMHRYESRFPEVSADGEYERREHAFKNICRWARGVIVDSTIGREQVVQSYGMEKDCVHVLPYVVPDSLSSAPDPGDFDERYDLPDKFLFYPAQFWEHKNHKGLFKAISGVGKDLSDLKLVLVGGAKNAHDSSLQLAQELGIADRIRVYGYVPDEDMPVFYRRARALVLPSFFGPTNIPPLEAMALGCPMAVSNVYGMPEQVGEAALLFDPKSEEDIRQAIRRLWRDDRLCADLARKGKARAWNWRQPHFDACLASILERVLGPEAANVA